MKLIQILKSIFIEEEQKTVRYEIPKVIPNLTRFDTLATEELELKLMRNLNKGDN